MATTVTNPIFTSAALPDGNGGFVPCPMVMTEAELILFLRVPEISDARDLHNVIEWLKRTRGLPCVHLGHNCVYFLPAVLNWLSDQATTRKGK